MAIDVSSTQAIIDEEQADGYRGARVDPNPNSAYSMQSDPMTSPSAPRHGTDFLIIDEYADPNSPYFDQIHGRKGLTDAEFAAGLSETLLKTITAQATAGTAGNAQKVGDAPADGTATSATFTATTEIIGDAANNRTFKVYNKTADHPLYTLTTTATLAAGVETAMAADGADQSVSLGDVIEVRQSVAGTGVAHGGGDFAVVVTQPA